MQLVLVNRRPRRRRSTSISAATMRSWPRSATSATCRQRTVPSIPTPISACSGRSTPRREAAQRHRPRRQGRRQAHPRDRPRSRGRSHFVARARGSQGEESAQAPARRARRVQRHHQAGGDGSHEASARHRSGAGRCLSGAPRARLSGGLHAVAGAMAQASGRAFGRAGAVGGAAAGVDRELDIEKFVSREYWSLVATLATPRQETFEARLVGADGKKLTRLDIGSGAEAEAFKQALETAAFAVENVEAKPVKRHPQPPFTTSTLQQEASRKLGFAPAHTMRVAQRLYEGVDIGGETVGSSRYANRRRPDRGRSHHRGAQRHRRRLRAPMCRTRRAATRPKPRTPGN